MPLYLPVFVCRNIIELKTYSQHPYIHFISGKNPSPMWDRLVFNKIKEKLGGRVRLMVSGASPLSPDIMEFLKMYVLYNVGVNIAKENCPSLIIFN